MPRKRTKVVDSEPKTQMEAVSMIWKIYGWLCKRNPIWVAVGLYMAFGGAVYGYKYLTTNAVQMQEITQEADPDVMHPAVQLALLQYKPGLSSWEVSQQDPDGQIVFGGRAYPFKEDKTLEIKAVLGEPFLLVYDKTTGKVFKMAFDRGIKSMAK